MDQESFDDLAFFVDFNAMCIVWDGGGFSTPIIAMIDRFDMETEDPEEADRIYIRMPPDGLVLCLSMLDLLEMTEETSTMH